ncbi:MAG: glucosamine-1-phosphate N-acetyltransferase [Dysosmobacter sp.]|nr:glucosamine-1-phosphate N-acetyltransferase [Dysosmobacter sp.]
MRRFFVACAPEFTEEVRNCFRTEDNVTVSGSREDLLAFLAEDGPVAVLPGPVLPVPEGTRHLDSCACTAEAAALRRGWENGGIAGVTGTVPLEGFADIATPREARELSLLCRDDVVDRLLDAGAEILDPDAVYIGPRVELGENTVVLPGTILRGAVKIGRNCEIGPNTMIRDCVIGDDTTVNASQLNESTVGSRTNIGPFAYVRPNCRIGDDIKVGDFVEVKNSSIGDGTKISHLTYVGDSDVGRKVNFGCGTVTTNYDGFRKYRCTIGDRAFIGCNTNLVAPVTVGEGAYTAAGSTITEEVPADALAVARSRQKNLEGWAERRRRMHENHK